MNQNKINAYYDYVYNLILKNKSKNENIIKKNNNVLFFPTGYSKLSLPQESYLKIFYVKEIDFTESIIQKVNSFIQNENHYAYINEDNTNNRLLISDRNLHKLISFLSMSKLELDIFNKIDYKMKFEKLTKCLDIKFVEDLIFYYARNLILQGYFVDNKFYDYNLIKPITKNTIFPFYFNGIIFTEKNCIKNSDNIVSISGLKNGNGFISFFANNKYKVSYESDFKIILQSYVLYKLNTFNISDQFFYKYKCLYDKNAKNNINEFSNKTILNDELYLSTKDYINDPFDLDIRNVHYDRLKKHYSYSIDKNNNPLLLSLAKSSTNILLWSHYSDSHKGICFEYELKNILDKIDKDNFLDFSIIGNVSYNNDRTNFKNIRNAYRFLPFNTLLILFQIKSLFTKYSDWSYENEYRIVSFPNSKQNTSKGHIITVPYSHIYLTESVNINNEYYIKNNAHTSYTKWHRDLKEYILK